MDIYFKASTLRPEFFCLGGNPEMIPSLNSHPIISATLRLQQRRHMTLSFIWLGVRSQSLNESCGQREGCSG